MCYAIPGKVIEIKDSFVTIDYFGERRKAKNDFYKLSLGDYIYAQGGFVIQKISPQEAEETLQLWRKIFFKLQKRDLKLTERPKNLYRIANSIRQKKLGNSCCIHGILEFSNYCRNDCFYCGLRKSNYKIRRYRMDTEEIFKNCKYAVEELNFKAIVLQSGEDLWYTEEKLEEIVKKIVRELPVLLILSIGERDLKLYEDLYREGARGVLLRFETSNKKLYEKYRPYHHFEDRINLIKNLKDLGYLTFTGFLFGLPGESKKDILNDIRLTGDLNPDMFSFGPFIPHHHTPLAEATPPTLELALDTIARTRIMYPESRILVTTSLETLDKKNGLREGLLSGANSLMINITPEEYRKDYEIYPGRAGIELSLKERINSVIELLNSLGRAPTDLGI
ncbi:MAG: [FeFe] hydrogenase H-cluster radical SAM maturase HydE [Candidatus Omnitrophica bacterium]|nr:[FeFe] hydrogenase H-cluster radical SAM maturase HydE [Candidatus Omnitrophota bacterium]